MGRRTERTNIKTTYLAIFERSMKSVKNRSSADKNIAYKDHALRPQVSKPAKGHDSSSMDRTTARLRMNLTNGNLDSGDRTRADATELTCHHDHH